ncbi:GatB/YqeY domain-containing protein, partial [Patescibacteria group bacterium]|nr:GatB/YqeY domain-containing protein [Patescibacteria group bacterium]
MPEVEDKIKEELNLAIKSKDETVRSTLRMLLASIQGKEKEKQYKEKRGLTQEEIIDIISSEAKKRKDSINEFKKGGRQDLVDKEKAELEVLQKYLPEQMSEEEIKKLVEETIREVSAETMQDFGKIMGPLMPKLKGKADGNLVS